MKEKTIKINKKQCYILLSVLFFSLAVTFIDAVIHPPYFQKIPIKVLFFLALPMLFFVIWRDEWREFRALFQFRRQGLLISFLLAALIYSVILCGFFLTKNLIDFSGVTTSLSSGMGITANNFLWVAIYISIINSFLEEFFFRGFGFITLKKHVSSRFAYLFSPILFAVYHVGMLIGMFHPAVLLLLMLGLIIGGVIFNALNDKLGNIYPSWFVHMAANLAINTIGFMLFHII